MKYCSQCTAELEQSVPPGEDRPRKVCPACGTVHYENPRTVVGCIVERGDEVLLCRRAIEPSRGLWTTPAGFLEIGEGALAGARRETLEEAGARVEIVAPHAFLDLPHIGQCYALYRARLAVPEVSAGEESLEVAFFRSHELPWDEIAFPVVDVALRLLFEDRRADHAHVHLGALHWRGSGSRLAAASYELRDHLRVRLSAEAPNATGPDPAGGPGPVH